MGGIVARLRTSPPAHRRGRRRDRSSTWSPGGRSRSARGVGTPAPRRRPRPRLAGQHPVALALASRGVAARPEHGLQVVPARLVRGNDAEWGRGIDHGETVPSPSIATRACRSDDHARDGETVPRLAPLPRPAAVLARGPGGNSRRLRAVRLDPVRSPRGGGPESRPRPSRPRSGLPPRADRRSALRGTRALRDLQQGPQHRPDRRPALVPDHVDLNRAEKASGVFTEHAELVESSSTAFGRTATCRRPTWRHAGRSTGTGGQRTRCGRSSRRSPSPGSSGSRDVRATDGSTTSWSGSSRRISSPSGRRSSSSAASSSCRATAPTDSSGPEGRPRSGWGRAPAVPSVVSGARS